MRFGSANAKVSQPFQSDLLSGINELTEYVIPGVVLKQVEKANCFTSACRNTTPSAPV